MEVVWKILIIAAQISLLVLGLLILGYVSVPNFLGMGL
jgi:hypothetical protein